MIIYSLFTWNLGFKLLSAEEYCYGWSSHVTSCERHAYMSKQHHSTENEYKSGIEQFGA